MSAKQAPSAATDELLARVIAERPGAWNEFYRRFERLIISCIRKVFLRHGVPCHPADIEDQLNAVCLELIRNDYSKLRKFDPDRGYKLSSWIGLLATNATYDTLRRRGPQTQSIDGEEWFAETPDGGPSPQEIAAARESHRLLGDVISQLTAGEQQFIHYYYAENLEPTEIAKLMGISVNTVYSKKNKVRNRLKRLVNDMNIELFS